MEHPNKVITKNKKKIKDTALVKQLIFTEIFGILVLLSFDITAFTLIAYQRRYLRRT